MRESDDPQPGVGAENQARPRNSKGIQAKRKETLVKRKDFLFGFFWIPSSDSGLIKGLRPKQSMGAPSHPVMAGLVLA
jgi:hypothetical protein